MPGPNWIIEPIKPSHCCEGFSCNKPNLDDFLKKKALDQEQRNWSRTYVALKEGDDDRRVCGYFTIMAGAIVREAIPLDQTSIYPDFPVLHLGRLAVAMEESQQGLGTYLLMQVFKICLEVSTHIGICGINLKADDDAHDFYTRWGFTDTRDDRKEHLFIHLATIKETFEQAREDPNQPDLFEAD